MTLTYRSTVGRRLTVTEGDGNIRYLYNQVGESVVSPIAYGAVGDDATNDTVGLQAAINTGKHVDLLGLSYKASTLTQSTSSQWIFSSRGVAKITKNGDGDLLTASGDYVTLQNVSFRGDAAAPTFTGGGVVINADHPVVMNCGSRWMSTRALKCTGNHVQVYGTCDIYQTATGADYDVEVGLGGTATLYHELVGLYSSQSSGGILLVDTGSANITGGQFGKLTISSSTAPAGTGTNRVIGSRILGDITVGLSNAMFAANAVDAVTITFNSGTSGHQFDGSNVVANGATINVSSTNSNIVDPRDVFLSSYNVAWTASSVDPTLGNGILTGNYSKRGNVVSAAVALTISSTTSSGTGTWAFSLPFIPTTNLNFMGAAYLFDKGTNIRTGLVRTLNDGTARCEVAADSAATVNTSSVPFTWTTGDRCEFSLVYSI